MVDSHSALYIPSKVIERKIHQIKILWIWGVTRSATLCGVCSAVAVAVVCLDISD
jgi:L-alanine-DL-glutamate epimerase-like enolase superfamily enzyme